MPSLLEAIRSPLRHRPWTFSYFGSAPNTVQDRSQEDVVNDFKICRESPNQACFVVKSRRKLTRTGSSNNSRLLLGIICSRSSCSSQSKKLNRRERYPSGRTNFIDASSINVRRIQSEKDYRSGVDRAESTRSEETARAQSVPEIREASLVKQSVRIGLKSEPS